MPLPENVEIKHRPNWIQTCIPSCYDRRGLSSLPLELGCLLTISSFPHTIIAHLGSKVCMGYLETSFLKDLTNLCPAQTLSVTDIQHLLPIQPPSQPHLLPSERTKHTKFSFPASQLLFALTRLVFQTSDVLGRSTAVPVLDGHSVHAESTTNIQRLSRNQGSTKHPQS